MTTTNDQNDELKEINPATEIEVKEINYESLAGEQIMWHEQFIKDLSIDGYI